MLSPSPSIQGPRCTMSLDAIHHELGEACTGARMWGPSAKFAGQRVGREHEVADLDEVEVLGR